MSVCASFPGTRHGAKLYRQTDFESILASFPLTLRSPRFAEPGDIEPHRDSLASYPFTGGYTFLGDAVVRFLSWQTYEPLLVPRRHRRRWSADTFLLQRRGQRPAVVRLPDVDEAIHSTGLLRELYETFQGLETIWLETFIWLRKSGIDVTAAALPPAEATEEDGDADEEVEFEDEPTNGEEENTGSVTVPAVLVIDVNGEAPSEVAENTDVGGAPAASKLTFPPSLEEEALQHFKKWLRTNHSEAHEIFDSRLWNSFGDSKSPAYYYQKRAFALRADVLSKDDLKWLGKHDAQERQLSPSGLEKAVSVLVIPRMLAKERVSLSSYIRSHLHQLEGSVQYEAHKINGDALTTVGWYYPRLVLVQLRTLKGVLGEINEVPPSTLKEVRLRVRGKSVRLREVVLDDESLL